MTAQFLTELTLTAMQRAAVPLHTAATVMLMRRKAKRVMTVPTTTLTVTATHGVTVLLLTAATVRNRATKHAIKLILNMAKAKESVPTALTTARLQRSLAAYFRLMQNG